VYLFPGATCASTLPHPATDWADTQLHLTGWKCVSGSGPNSTTLRALVFSSAWQADTPASRDLHLAGTQMLV
jgi:hypothetical protein